MNRGLSLLGAVTNLGLKPYDEDGRARGLDQAPRVLRELGVVARVGAADRGDVVAEPYRDFVRPSGRVRNDEEIARHSHALADAVEAATRDGDFLLLLGGDCSILLGALLGFRRRGSCALAFLDGHADFATPATSYTGAAAGMDLALAVGRGDSPLARLGDGPLVAEEDAVVIGRRDHVEDPLFGDGAVGYSNVLDLAAGNGAAATALERIGRKDFFIHLDVDILDSTLMPAVDSPQPGGLEPDELVALLRPLVHHPRALGLEVTIYDPALDGNRVWGRLLVDVLERVLR